MTRRHAGSSLAILFVLTWFTGGTCIKVKVNSPIVSTENGLIQGYQERSRGGRLFYSYVGIPFAKPPIGQLRFESPQVYDGHWEDVLRTVVPSPSCVQHNVLSGAIAGSEDCLYLNVHVPKNPHRNESMDVFAWVYGGQFHAGGNNEHRPHYFMDENVIFVSMNYRLGALGFLNTGDPEGLVRGNMGMKDQRLALRWIQANIAKFGGNPKRVTLFGNSSGGVAVHYHMLSSSSAGLFHKAISESGSAGNVWALHRKPAEQARRFARNMGCPQSSVPEMVNCMKSASVKSIMDANLGFLERIQDEFDTFRPSVETKMDEDSFLTENPLTVLKEGRGSRVPWMVGVNSMEGVFVSAALKGKDRLTKFDTDWNFATEKVICLENEVENNGILAELRQYYVGNLRCDSQEGFRNISNLFTDALFADGIDRAARLQSEHSPVYLYHYAYRGKFTWADYLLAAKGRFPVEIEVAFYLFVKWIRENILRIPVPFTQAGVSHADELALLFPLPLFRFKITQADKDYGMSRDLVKLWTDFGKYEDPLYFRGEEWLPVNSQVRENYFLIDSAGSGMIENPFAERIEFMRELGLYDWLKI